MRLKEVLLAVGFMLVSLTRTLSEDVAVMVELGLAKGEWELEGCLVSLTAHSSTSRAEHFPENSFA
jgi:hypothetical protein